MGGETTATGGDHIHDFQRARSAGRGDVLLQKKAKRLGDDQGKGGEANSEGETGDFIGPAPRPKHGRGPRQTPGHPRGDKVRAAVGVNGEFVFAVFHPQKRFGRASADEVGVQFAEEPETAGVGVSGHRGLRGFTGEEVDGGMFQAVVAADAGEGSDF